MPLTDAAIRAAKPGDKPRKLFDGHGLYLLITPKGGKWWRVKYAYQERHFIYLATGFSESSMPIQPGFEPFI